MIAVTINGSELKELESLSLSRSLDSLCGQFEIQCLPSTQNFLKFKTGDKVVIRYENRTVFSGIIDTLSKSIRPKEKKLVISGRDITSILVDSSAIHNPMGFDGVTLTELAEALCDRYGIQVKSYLTDETSHPNWYLFYGETVFEALDRMAKIDGALFITSEKGELIIAKPTINSDALVSIKEGINLFEMSFTSTQKGLYENYKLTTYAQGLGNAIGVLKTLSDSTVNNNKTLIIDSEGLSSDSLVKRRLNYEMRTRKARATQVSAHVPGWVDLNGSVFKLNTLVSLECESINLNEKHLNFKLDKEPGSSIDYSNVLTHNTNFSTQTESISVAQHYLISGLGFTLDKENGFTTDITMCIPDAWIPDPAAEIRLNALFDLLRKDQQK